MQVDEANPPGALWAAVQAHGACDPDTAKGEGKGHAGYGPPRIPSFYGRHGAEEPEAPLADPDAPWARWGGPGGEAVERHPLREQDPLGLDSLLPHNSEIPEFVTWDDPRSAARQAVAPLSPDDVHRTLDANDHRRMFGVVVQLLVNGRSGLNPAHMVVSLLAPLAVHRGWVPLACLARAMVTTPQELQTLLLGPDALDGEGRPLYAGTAIPEGETTARWIAPMAGTWQSVVAQAMGPPEILEVREYRRLLARYPTTHWVFNSPIPLTVIRPFVDWGNKGKTKSNRDKGKGKDKTKGSGKLDKGYAKGYGKAWDKGYDKGYGKGYGYYDKGFDKGYGKDSWY